MVSPSLLPVRPITVIPENETRTMRALIRSNLTSASIQRPKMYTNILEVLQSMEELDTEVDAKPLL